MARSLPALIRAEKLQDKARKAGFDWPDLAPALDKLDEEVGELRRAAQGDGDPQEELGDLLFAAVKAGRFLHVDSEQALTQACEKFIRRFRAVERAGPGREPGPDGAGPAGGALGPRQATGGLKRPTQRTGLSQGRANS